MSTVLIADHHPVVHEGIRCILRKNPALELVGSVHSGMELYGFLSESQPDVLIIEIDLPEINGINALRTIKTDYSKVKILVCTGHPEEVYALSAIKAGAAGYISKLAKPEELEKAIYQVARGGIYLNKKITDKLNAGMSPGRNLIAKFKKLSTRESEVLNLIASGKRNKDIAEALSINEKTVSTYKTRLLKKLQVDNIADLITRSRLLQINTT
ncbi:MULTISPECIES: response regulator [Salegentibacter]|jgi:DNA-binding NarL/FixJ family response regulator|uniref:Two component transcriptional regulator, LuxR family n=1 Tax=Salegentibacter agarivorans TaxID=345907 RepID=A0A1I2LK43_9FLAO|nr:MULTISPECIES: response regulator transcription factor [Salegentibacter]APS37639.1 two-component system response regulator [Salegentibacter sp. T436]SFF79852.1 two component transcriptional regulator, LuxR family [Salegentibacter agarivorans]|tara:strand:- start:722 stop:1360 length:639 start_codon:yes stop_codon:yes gene_type:complete